MDRAAIRRIDSRIKAARKEIETLQSERQAAVAEYEKAKAIELANNPPKVGDRIVGFMERQRFRSVEIPGFKMFLGLSPRSVRAAVRCHPRLSIDGCMVRLGGKASRSSEPQ